jgi:hypothetical protein
MPGHTNGKDKMGMPKMSKKNGNGNGMPTKGSKAMKERMAKLRAMKKK